MFFLLSLKYAIIIVIGSIYFARATNSTTCQAGSCTPQKIICYFTNWATNRTDKSQFKSSDIDTTLCTNIIYSFAVLNPTTLKIEMGLPEVDGGSQKMYEQITALKSKGLNVSLALGGWADSANGSKYSQMVNNGIARTNFVHDTVRFLRKHNFDGIDLNWEYPTCWMGNCSLGPISDRNNFANLVRELRTAFKFYGLLLSAAVSPDSTISNAAYHVVSLANHLDWIGIMAYDYHPASTGTTGHHSPYMGPHPNTVDAIELWLRHGVSPQKLIMGIPLYGRSFTLLDSNIHGIGAPATIGKPALYTKEAGFIAYFEFCNSWTYNKVPGIGSYAVKDDQWVSYNDITLIQEKAEHVKQYKLGGVMVWALDLDDFDGQFCSLGKYPLLTALNKSLSK